MSLRGVCFAICLFFHVSSISWGILLGTNIEEDYIPLLGYSILYKEYNLTGFNHQKNYSCVVIDLGRGGLPLGACGKLGMKRR